MKILIGLLLALCVTFSLGSETVVQHHSYKTYYDAALREPDSVAYDLSPQMTACDPQIRKDAFKADPLIPGSATPSDYTNSGYDKGHLFSYDDAQCSEVDKIECFYMSNMLPQLHPFNAGDWKILEIQERRWAKSQRLHIIAGGCGSLGKLKAGENIPQFMWKAILVNGRYLYWIMPNSNDTHGHKYDYWLKSKTEFDKATGLTI